MKNVEKHVSDEKVPFPTLQQVSVVKQNKSLSLAKVTWDIIQENSNDVKRSKQVGSAANDPN